MAWGIDPETRNILSWGLQYRVIGGAPEDSIDDMELWAEYDRLLRSSVWRFPHIPGELFGPWKVLIDSGWGERSDLVRSFCRQRYAEERRQMGVREIAPFAATVLPLKSQSIGRGQVRAARRVEGTAQAEGQVGPGAVFGECHERSNCKDMIHQSVFRDGKLPEDRTEV